MNKAPVLIIALALILFIPVNEAADMSPQQRRGQQIYLQGTSAQGSEILARLDAADIQVPAALMPCVNCHGHDGRGEAEGGVVASDIRWSVLTKPYRITLPNGRKRPPYHERALKKAISMGLDPTGTELNGVMPRYQLTRQDMEDLIAYLKELGEYSVPGVTPSSIRLGVILPAENAAKSSAIQASLLAFISAQNTSGGIYQRQIALHFITAPTSDPQSWNTFRASLEKANVFALVASHLDGIDAWVNTFCEQSGMPIVGGFSQYPILDFPPNRYIFYLFSGSNTQSLALAAFARQQHPIDASKIRIISTGESRFQKTANAIANIWKSQDQHEPEIVALPAETEVLTIPGKNAIKNLAAQLRKGNIELIVFVGGAHIQEAFLSAAAELQWWPTVMLPGAQLNNRLFSAAPGFDKRIFVALPALPRDYSAKAIDNYRHLSDRYGLPKAYGNTQLQAIAAATLLLEGLTRSGRELNREKLIDSLENFYRFETRLTKPITYGPNRRLGISGAYIVSLDLPNKTIAPELEWIEVEY